MSRWLLRLLLVGLATALGIWIWRSLFPNPESVIRARLTELAQAASFGPKDGPLALLLNPDKIVGLCTADVQVRVGSFGYSQTLNGREDIRKAATAVRTSFTSLSLKFPDIRVQLEADRESAVVYATANGRVSGDRELQLIELRFIMRKIGSEWLIASVETASALH